MIKEDEISTVHIGLDKDTNIVPSPVISSTTDIKKPDTLHGWIVVAASSFYLMCSIGMGGAFGVFITHYLNDEYKDVKASTLSWIGTSMTVFAYSSTFITGPLIARFRYQHISLVGSVLCTLGLLLASFSTTVWQLILTQGIIFGIGISLTFSLLLTIPVDWHQKYREIATGITAASFGVGGILFTETTGLAIDRFGIKWALRINALIVFVICTCSSFIIKRRTLVPSKIGNIWSTVKDIRIIMFALSNLFVNMTYFVPTYYLPSAALNIGATQHEADNLVMFLNVGDTIGKLIAALTALVIGPLNTAILYFSLCVVIVPVFMLAIKSLTGYIIFSFLYGLFSTGPISVTPIILVTMVDFRSTAAAMGVYTMYAGIGALIGVPVQGAIYDRFDRGETVFIGTTVWCTLGIFIGVMFLLFLKAMLTRNSNIRILSKI